MSRARRRRAREPTIVSLFGEKHAQVALDLFELLELAWHDCYGEVNPPDRVVEDILVLSDGDIHRLIRVALEAVTDWRDVRVAADESRNS